MPGFGAENGGAECNCVLDVVSFAALMIQLIQIPFRFCIVNNWYISIHAKLESPPALGE